MNNKPSQLTIKYLGCANIIIQVHNYGSGDKVYIGTDDKEVIIIPLADIDNFAEFIKDAKNLGVSS